MDADILTTLLKGFNGEFVLALQRLVPQALMLFQVLVSLQLMFLGVWMLMGNMSDIGPTLATITLKLAVYLWMITGWGHLTRTIAKGFIAYGLHGGGSDISEEDFTDPSKILWFGITAMVRVFNRIFAYTGWDAVFNWADIFFTGIAALCVLVAFVWFGFHVFGALLEFYGLTAVIIILVPFGILPYTAFLAEKAISAVWAHAIKLLILSFVTGIALTIMKSPLLEPGLNPGFWACFSYAVAGAGMVWVAIKVPKIAEGFLQGSPQLTAQDFQRAASSTMEKVVKLGAAVEGGALAAQAAQRAENAATERRRA